MHPNPKKIAPVILVLVILAIAWFYFGGTRATADTGKLSASGTIEATQVEIGPELGGRAVEVLVGEGDRVQSGQPLVRLDDALLQSQLKQAQASLALAQANYDLVAAGATEEQRQAAITAAELELKSARQALNDLNDTAELARARAEQALATAEKAVDSANDRVNNLQTESSQADIDAAHASMILAKDKLEKAQKDFDPWEKKADDNVIRAAMEARLAAAQKQYDATVTRYNNLQGTANALDLNLAEADLAVAKAQQADAEQRYEKLKDGPDPDQLELAQARLDAAEARLAAAQADPSQKQLAVAQNQVEVAQAAVDLLLAQIEKLVLKAPMEGIVLTRSVEPGEFVAPGAPLLTLARLDELDITIYVSEDRYGTISLGQKAQVSVDSFPGQTFEATVAHIADRAEYTPRNVQTAEGRRTTVFAVKLAVENPEGKLKPGMPADVAFGD